MKPNYLLLVLLVLFTAYSALAQERDTTRNGEEILLASDLFKKTDEERRVMLLKPRFSYINMEDKLSIIQVGFRPYFGPISGTGNKCWFPANLGVGYERMLKEGSPFSLKVESIVRLHNNRLEEYDYKVRREGMSFGAYQGRQLTGGIYQAHRFRLHLSARYYFNFKKRLEAEVTGQNPFSEYVFFKLRDLTAFTEESVLDFNSDRQLLLHSVSDKWVVRPAYFGIGIGIQRPIFGKLLLDMSAEVGQSIPFKKAEYVSTHRDVLIDINLFIGFGF